MPEAHENIDSEIDESDLYQIDNMSLDKNKQKKEWLKRAFESKQKNKYDIEIHNGMTCIHGNKVNIIFEWNLLHDILNPLKITKKLNIHYSPILHGCINTRKGRSRFNNFRILLHSGCNSTIIMGRLTKKLNPK